MIDDVQSYSLEPICFKCGALTASIRTQYRKETYSDSTGIVEIDYLERTCKVCGYTWNEHCADSGG